MAEINPQVKTAMLHVEQVLLDHIAPIFSPQAKFTLLVRLPGNEAANVMLTTDTAEAVDALARQFNVPDAQHEVRASPIADLIEPCCANEKRGMNGGCLSCGDPCV